MATQLSVQTAGCTEYQRLLEESQKALDIWNALRVEVQVRATSKETGDELLRLQANYARAYSALSKHSHRCPHCQLILRIGDN